MGDLKTQIESFEFVTKQRKPLKNIKEHIDWLEKSLADIDNDIQRTIKKSPFWKVDSDIS